MGADNRVGVDVAAGSGRGLAGDPGGESRVVVSSAGDGASKGLFLRWA